MSEGPIPGRGLFGVRKASINQAIADRDLLLHRAQARAAAAEEELARVRHELESVRGQLASHAAVPTAETVADDVRRILRAAEESATEITRYAAARSEAQVRDAEERAATLLETVRRENDVLRQRVMDEATAMLATAREQAEAIVGSARERAGATTREAEARAGEIEREALARFGQWRRSVEPSLERLNARLGEIQAALDEVPEELRRAFEPVVAGPDAGPAAEGAASTAPRPSEVAEVIHLPDVAEASNGP